MKIVLKRPSEKPVEMDCDPGEGYAEWRSLLEGWVQYAPYDEDGIDMYFDEEGKLKQLAPNFVHPRYRQVVGNVIFASRRRVRGQVIPCSLSESQTERILRQLSQCRVHRVSIATKVETFSQSGSG